MSAPENTSWKEVATLADIPALGGRVVATRDGEIALLRNERGEVYALDNRCPHKGGPLAEGAVSGDTVYCPLHNWRIDLTCGEARDPDTGCVRTWPVRLEGERVFIRLPE
ncbi:nitrite reductase (NAD(P)H) small subunit [Acidiferrobacter sp. SPIII_3]|jgi:nitrite reductase (NADH) small subunit|uniref:nitrite reductase small subunit NirD n=1 Tax=Acidiferrobacter sp. SPIII_3 TaxID=1281578 RepID=UPI000D72A8F7|nr:nitrite reductase small subunit NirD [Acidiferrobacter sp. SPIII_3]AWP22928.1 nitrite reductase (NAD(P)H) small subunit [Acidiferrobacter sp. SPIII_3]